MRTEFTNFDGKKIKLIPNIIATIILIIGGIIASLFVNPDYKYVPILFVIILQSIWWFAVSIRLQQIKKFEANNK